MVNRCVECILMLVPHADQVRGFRSGIINPGVRAGINDVVLPAFRIVLHVAKRFGAVTRHIPSVGGAVNDSVRNRGRWSDVDEG